LFGYEFGFDPSASVSLETMSDKTEDSCKSPLNSSCAKLKHTAVEIYKAHAISHLSEHKHLTIVTVNSTVQQHNLMMKITLLKQL
jgi:hypothetical protein